MTEGTDSSYRAGASDVQPFNLYIDIPAVTNLFVDEALRAEEHPGITFRPGPTGRRAGLVGGPDVWEVIDTLLIVREAEPGLADDALVAPTAEAMVDNDTPGTRARHAGIRYEA